MSFDDYDNPVSEVNDREFESIENLKFFLKDYLHKELSGSNQGAYCFTHHSIETRSTKKNHASCVLYGPSELKGKIIRDNSKFLGKDADETWENLIRKAGDRIIGDDMISIFVRKLEKHSNKLKDNKDTQSSTSNTRRTINGNSQQNQLSSTSNLNPQMIIHFPNNSQFPFPYPSMQVPSYPFMNGNPFLPSDPRKTEEMVKLLVYQMFEEMRQSFDQKIFNIEKNQAQHENILNQIFTEIKVLKNNKAQKKQTQKNQQNQNNQQSQQNDERALNVEEDGCENVERIFEDEKKPRKAQVRKGGKAVKPGKIGK